MAREMGGGGGGIWHLKKIVPEPAIVGLPMCIIFPSAPCTASTVFLKNEEKTGFRSCILQPRKYDRANYSTTPSGK